MRLPILLPGAHELGGLASADDELSCAEGGDR